MKLVKIIVSFVVLVVYMTLEACAWPQFRRHHHKQHPHKLRQKQFYHHLMPWRRCDMDHGVDDMNNQVGTQDVTVDYDQNVVQQYLAAYLPTVAGTETVAYPGFAYTAMPQHQISNAYEGQYQMLNTNGAQYQMFNPYGAQ